MKQIYKLIFIASLLLLPFSVFAQEGISAPENESNPIIDNGLEQEQVQESSAVEQEQIQEPDLVTLSEISDPQPLIHIEQLGWNTFKFRSSYRLGLEQYETLWSFGDEQVSSQRIVHHTYSKPGVYQVKLEILTEDGQRVSVSNTVQVGFFNLANWRLWVLILLLAVIIIVASVIAGVKEESTVKEEIKKKKNGADEEEFLLNALSEDLGDFDSLGQIGLDTHSLKEELAFLEEMDMPKKKKATKKKTKQTKEKKKIKVKSKKPRKTTKSTKTKKTSVATKKTKKKTATAKKKTPKTSTRSTTKKTSKKSVKK